MSTSRLFAAAVSTALLLGGCANSSALQYTTSQAQNTARVYYGEVLSVTPTRIRGEDNPLITAAGSLLGGIGGSNFGNGRGEAVSAILGAVVGGLGTQSLTRGLDIPEEAKERLLTLTPALYVGKAEELAKRI